MRAVWPALAAIASLGAAGPRYGDTLLAGARGVSAGAAVHVQATGRAGVPIALGPMDVRGSGAVLTDAMGEPIGEVTVADGPARAAAVVQWLKRRIYAADDLLEPDPLVAGAPRWPRAQALVERALALDPDLVTLAFHVDLPAGGNRIVASSFGRIGKEADADDLRVVRDGAVLREVTSNGRRLAVELPLTDRHGRTIGALSTSFVVPRGADPQSAFANAMAVRNSIARRIPSLASLAAP